MSEHELEKLLGGFAADTLTQEERQKLFTAALHDQQLFNALADEQALKELLADPAVRRRLLQVLRQASPSSAGGLPSWLNWCRRPAGLAFAGGLAAAVFAVVLGTRIYQDSLKQAGQSVTTEEGKLAAPPTPEAPSPPTPPPAQPFNDKIELKAKENAPSDKNARRESPSTPSTVHERQAAGVARDQMTQQSERHETPKQAETPTPSLGKAAGDVTASADEKPLKQSSMPPAAAPEPSRMQAAAAIGSTTGARALFYVGDAGRLATEAVGAEREQGLMLYSESAPQASRPERKLDQLAALGKATQFKPLGLRYSFIVRGADGHEREVDKTTAAGSAVQAELTVEANQDAYLQILKTVGGAPSQTFYPQSVGESSLPIAAGKRYEVPLPALTESEATTLTIWLSRKPLLEVQKQEAGSAIRPSSTQLVESITPGGSTDSQEQATYIVTTAPSTNAQIVVDIFFGK